MPSKFAIIGSAHNEVDIKIKEKQGCSLVFIPIDLNYLFQN